jgi:protein phosphatase
LLATEGSAHFDKPHLWHLGVLAKLAHANGEELIMQTAYKTVDLASSDDCLSAVEWWTDLTSNGGEGMVIKPQDFIATGTKGFVQPAVKCRGKEYLRIIYGPDYDDERYLQRLRQRGLNTKRSLAMREFALGVESVERFVRREPLYRVHEAVFAVLAMESEPVDPRL